jgi:hypothetical protein
MISLLELAIREKKVERRDSSYRMGDDCTRPSWHRNNSSQRGCVLMEEIKKILSVEKVEEESPFVRVLARFHEGGTSSKSHKTSRVSFLCEPLDQPRVGKELIMTIKER